MIQYQGVRTLWNTGARVNEHDDQQLGVVTDGSFSAGLTVRLNGGAGEDLQVGSFVVLEGNGRRYFSLINDLQLRATDPGIISDPPVHSPFIRAALSGIHTYTAAMVRPSLVIDNADSIIGDAKPRAVRTIPTHFAEMRRAREEDFDLVFGAEGDDLFAVGSPIAMDGVNVTIDLKKLVERPSGIFGQTGTGKSVLTRLILFGIIRSDIASALVFDMHDEYADEKHDKPGIPGLRDLFDSTRVKVFSLDDRSRAGYTIKIGMNQIEPADIELLRDELNLNDTFSSTTFLLHRQYGEKWLSKLLTMDADETAEFVAASGAHQGAVEALKRKLAYLEERPFILPISSTDPVREIVLHLQQGRHVIVQFGRYHDLRDYMLVTNLLSRRIHQEYTERAQAREIQPGIGSERPVTIVLEEAHKFLSPSAARQSIFGTIAREMRKFGVSLMVVDQRPSQIDSEVMSQLATRISGLLTDENDISAVLSGTGDRSALRSMLASLEPSQQCLVVGHAIPMPMVVRTRAYSRALTATANGKRPDQSLGLSVLLGGRRDD